MEGGLEGRSAGRCEPAEDLLGGGDSKVSYTSDLLNFVQKLDTPCESFLEIGCNAGRNLHALCQAHPDARICGVDINEDAIAFARQNAPAAKTWDLRIGNLADPGLLGRFGDGEIDLVFSMAVLVHLPPGAIKSRIISECFRIAKHGLLMIEPHRDGKPVWNTVTDRRVSPFSIDNYLEYLPSIAPLILPVRDGVDGTTDLYKLLYFPKTPQPQ